MSQSTAVATFSGFKQEFEAAWPQLSKLLPAHVKPEKFQVIVMGVVTNNPDLLTVDRRSLFKACRDAAELGLSLNPALGEADILKQYDKRAGGYVARFSPRYGGLMKLARQSGQIRTIYAHTVRENDTFDQTLGTAKEITHKPASQNRGALVGVYCVWHMTNGTVDFEYMDKDQVLAIRARSSAKTKDGAVVGPWVTDEEEMWRKTVVRRASKYMPRSPEVERIAAALNEFDGDTIEGAPVPGVMPEDAVDVTDWPQDTGGAVESTAEVVPEHLVPPAPAPAPVAKAAAQVDALAARVAPAPAATPETPKAAPAKRARVVPVPQKDGQPDWSAYAATMQDYLSQQADAPKAWANNLIVLNNLKTARPDLYANLDGFMQTL